MSMGSSPVRMLWISIRAIQYTDRATQQVVGNMSKLMAAEEKLHRRTAILSIAGGVMWIALASMATSAIMSIMRTTREGAGIMNQFDKSLGQLTKSFGTAFVKVLGPTIKILTNLFDVISKLPMPVLTFIASGIMLGLTFLTIKGLTMTLSGVFNLLGLEMWKETAANLLFAQSEGVVLTSTQALKVGIMGLVGSLQKVLVGFTLFMSLGIMLGKNYPAIVAAMTAITVAIIALGVALHWTGTWMSVLTFGAAAIAGLAASAAVSASMPNYQVGTRRLQKSGPIYAHAGEMVGTERGLKAQMGGKDGSPDKQQMNVTLNFSGNIQTKADKEELRPLILKVVKEALDNKV